MKKLLLALLLSASFAAHAVPVLELGDLRVRLLSSPCELVEGEFMKAEVTWQGKALRACWKPVDNMVFIGDETGDSGFLPNEGWKDDGTKG